MCFRLLTSFFQTVQVQVCDCFGDTAFILMCFICSANEGKYFMKLDIFVALPHEHIQHSCSGGWSLVTPAISQYCCKIVVTARQQPQPQQQTTITVVGLRLSNRWEYHHHNHPHPHPHHHTNSKLHDRAEIEQNSENKSY